MQSVRLFVLLSLLVVSCATFSWPPKVQEVGDESPVLSPEEELESFVVAPGFQIELVASEPMIHDPVAIDFDADGRMYVVEMRSYMPTVEGEGELTPNGRVSVLEDLDGDGRMDRSTVFMDSLVLPRAVKVLDESVLVGEPPYLWLATDTTGDLRADVKEIIRIDYGVRESNPERNPNGLAWSMDNDLLNVWWDKRLRLDDEGRWEAVPTFDRGQWGISIDDYGRVYRNWNEGALYVDYLPDYYYARNPHMKRMRGMYEFIVAEGHEKVWPIRPNPGVNRGYREGVLRENGTLHRFTAAGSPVVYRGDRYPQDVPNNVFVTEPAGNLVRRFYIAHKEDGTMSAESAYYDAEFLASTDERFRPVNLFSAPDGTLYVVDMYRGIVQHREYLTEYLEDQIIRRDLDEPVGLGRIWRVKHEAWKPGPQPRLSTEEDLVDVLRHPNGWWRDTAQRLLVLRGDASVAPALRRLARRSKDVKTKLHALWTLHGLGVLDPETVLYMMEDPDAKLRAAAVRGSERWTDQPEIQEAIARRVDDFDVTVRRQVAASLGEYPPEFRIGLLEDMLARHGHDPITVDAGLSGLRHLEYTFLRRLLERDEEVAGDAISMTAAALLNSGRGFQYVFGEIGNEQLGKRWRIALLDGVLAFAPRLGRPESRPLLLEAAPEGLIAAGESTDEGIRMRAREALLRLTWPGKPEPERPAVPPLTAEEQEWFAAGAESYGLVCAPCHGGQGEGREGLPLAGSERVVGPKDPLIRIILHGKEGERLMPPMGHLTDEQVSEILTFIRRSWGNEAVAVSPSEVKEVRGRTQFRAIPWSESELN